MPALSAETLAAVGERVPVPAYDRAEVTAGVVHVGVGGFHRAHQAMYQDRLMNGGAALDWGICGVGVLPGDRRMKEALEAQDHLYTLVVKHDDGRLEPRVIGSIVDYLFAPEDPERVVERMAAEAVRIVSLTITEGGYAPEAGAGVFALVVQALRRRRERGLAPFTIMSCDNLQGNGDHARSAFAGFARSSDLELGDWIERAVSFPNSMVDRITPATTDQDRRDLREQFGIEDRWPVVCESYEQWVLEDDFVAGRPPYEDAGAHIVGEVGPYEKMKVRLLNGSHQAMGYFGQLCGHRMVHEATRDPLIRRFLLGYLDDEVTPTLDPVPGVDLPSYKRTLMERFCNPGVADSLARQTVSSSDRIPVFVLPVVRDRLAAGGSVAKAAAIVASWARYAEGTDEQGGPFEVVDPRRDRLMASAARERTDPGAFLADRDVFGDLGDDERFAGAYRAALASLHERGARATLESLVS